MKELIISIERFLYTARTTIGKLYFLYDGFRKEYFCYTLEDTVRPTNIKVFAETCLPGGLLANVGLFENDHYKKTLIIFTEDDKETILVGILKWVACLFHNGVTHLDTEGCVLVGGNYIPPVYDVNHIITAEPSIYNPMKEALRTFIEQKIKEDYTIKVQFTNLDQLN